MSTHASPSTSEPSLIKRNYKFEKQKKDAAKKRKQEQKRQDRLDRSAARNEAAPEQATNQENVPPQ